MNAQKTPFPLRLEDGLREAVGRLAQDRQRSLNWQLNFLVKTGLDHLQKESASTAATVKRSV